MILLTEVLDREEQDLTLNLCLSSPPHCSPLRISALPLDSIFFALFNVKLLNQIESAHLTALYIHTGEQDKPCRITKLLLEIDG